MADFGYEYVNVDDCWMVKPEAKEQDLGGEPRDASGAIRPNGRFPDMKGLADYIHAKGLKAGLYTSPGPLTCAGFTGSYQHEEQDARRFAEWGFDFLKYDWCSYEKVADGEGLERFQKPYRLMGDLLARQPRDMVLNLCQYGMGEVSNWGAAVGGHSWRTTGDLGLEKSTRLPGFYSIAFANARQRRERRARAWNDPDYILIGQVGDANDTNAPPKKTSLTPSEQYSYMSLWSLMAAPLFYSGDITHLDEFTLNVLCNAEVIDVDQDPLGKQGRVRARPGRAGARPGEAARGRLAGGRPVRPGRASPPRSASRGTSWAFAGPQRVRDLWRQKDLGVFHRRYEATVSRHGVSLVRLTPVR